MSMHSKVDKLGATISGACAVHCAITPLLITLGPLLGLSFLTDRRFETAIILLALGLASISLAWGFAKKHRQFLPLGIMLFGIAAISIAQFELLEFPEPALMAFGGLSIAVSHIVNARLCEGCNDCNH